MIPLVRDAQRCVPPDTHPKGLTEQSDPEQVIQLKYHAPNLNPRRTPRGDALLYNIGGVGGFGARCETPE